MKLPTQPVGVGIKKCQYREDRRESDPVDES